jgi:hypothetical protein
MSVTVTGARGALGERDFRRVAESVSFTRDTSTAEALAAVLGGDAPAAALPHLEFLHAAVLVAVERVPDAVGVLADLGVEAREPIPSVVVRDRLRRRTGQDLDVRIVRGKVAGGPRELELFASRTATTCWCGGCAGRCSTRASSWTAAATTTTRT